MVPLSLAEVHDFYISLFFPEGMLRNTLVHKGLHRSVVESQRRVVLCSLVPVLVLFAKIRFDGRVSASDALFDGVGVALDMDLFFSVVGHLYVLRQF